MFQTCKCIACVFSRYFWNSGNLGKMVLFSLILVIKSCRNSPKNEEKSKNDLKVEFVCFGDTFNLFFKINLICRVQ